VHCSGGFSNGARFSNIFSITSPGKPSSRFASIVCEGDAFLVDGSGFRYENIISVRFLTFT
jgi:hypothetical protein